MSFFQFLLQSKNQYAVHSPFVYDFLTKCLYVKTPSASKRQLRRMRKAIIESNEVLEVTDIGKGSQRFKSVKRSACEIAGFAGMSWHKSKLINKMLNYFNFKKILELGTSVGLGSIAMAANHSRTLIETVEACPNTFSFAEQQFANLNLENIKVYNYEFRFFLQNISDRKKYDLIYWDGHHDKQATLDYFELIQKHIHQYSVVILDDIYWSKGMNEAWKTICNHESVKVSIDLYFWGILFFNPNLSKQHYKIRCFF